MFFAFFPPPSVWQAAAPSARRGRRRRARRPSPHPTSLTARPRARSHRLRAQKASKPSAAPAASDDTADLIKALERERENNEQLERQLQDILAMWERESAQARRAPSRAFPRFSLPSLFQSSLGEFQRRSHSHSWRWAPLRVRAPTDVWEPGRGGETPGAAGASRFFLFSAAAAQAPHQPLRVTPLTCAARTTRRRRP